MLKDYSKISEFNFETLLIRRFMDFSQDAIKRPSILIGRNGMV